MNSLTVLNGDGSILVTITDPIEFIFGNEKVQIPLGDLSPAQRVRLLRLCVAKYESHIRHVGISFSDIAPMFPWHTSDFEATFPTGFSLSTRLVQLCHPIRGGPLNYPPPKQKNSGWAFHTLYVSETLDFLLFCQAVNGSNTSQLRLEVLDDGALEGLLSCGSSLCKECMKFLGRMWSNMVRTDEDNLDRIRHEKICHQAIYERII